MAYTTEQRVPSRAVEVITGASCDECGTGIEGVFMTPEGVWESEQPKDALPIVLEGFYGGYYDRIHKNAEILLCEGCADRLCAAFPSFARAINRVRP